MNTGGGGSHRITPPGNPSCSHLSPHDAESPFLVSWACLAGLLHYLLKSSQREGGIVSVTPQPTSKIILSEGLTEPHATLKAFSDKGGLASSTLSEILCSCQTL